MSEEIVEIEERDELIEDKEGDTLAINLTIPALNIFYFSRTSVFITSFIFGAFFSLGSDIYITWNILNICVLFASLLCSCCGKNSEDRIDLCFLVYVFINWGLILDGTLLSSCIEETKDCEVSRAIIFFLQTLQVFYVIIPFLGKYKTRFSRENLRIFTHISIFFLEVTTFLWYSCQRENFQ